jgi:hypothetical protein
MTPAVKCLELLAITFFTVVNFKTVANAEDLKLPEQSVKTNQTKTNQIKSKSMDKQSTQIENVLENLEKRLTDKDDLQPQPNSPSAVSSHQKKGESYEGSNPNRISGHTPSGKNIQELQKKINEYEARIDILESNVQKFKSDVADTSATDNQVKLEVKSKKQSNFIIRTLIASLDGNTLYNQVDASGLWMPTKTVPVFYGPLQPGDHRLDVTATLAPLSESGLEMPTWKQKTLQQSFTFSVADGKIRKGIIVELSDTKGDGSQPQAELSEVELK